jgi:hypothetical protein
LIGVIWLERPTLNNLVALFFFNFHCPRSAFFEVQTLRWQLKSILWSLATHSAVSSTIPPKTFGSPQCDKQYPSSSILKLVAPELLLQSTDPATTTEIDSLVSSCPQRSRQYNLFLRQLSPPAAACSSCGSLLLLRQLFSFCGSFLPLLPPSTAAFSSSNSHHQPHCPLAPYSMQEDRQYQIGRRGGIWQ